MVSIQATDPYAAEAGPNAGMFTISRTGSAQKALTVSLNRSGTAANGYDYSRVGSTVTIGAGQTSAKVYINPIDDTYVEGTETVVMGLVSSSAYDLGSSRSATVSIADNDKPARNVAPTIASLTASPSQFSQPGTVTLTANGVNDSDGQVKSVTFYWETNGKAGLQTGTGGDRLLSTDTSSAGGWARSFGLSSGTFTFYAQATDDQGATSATGTSAPTATVTVRKPNAAPTVASITPSASVLPGSGSVTLTANGVNDPDGTIRSVTFYREINGIAGLQTGAGGDRRVMIDSDGSDGYRYRFGTGVAGTYVFYAMATDDQGATSATGTAAPSTAVTVKKGQPQPRTVYVGNHWRAVGRGWTWVDVDNDVVTPLFSGTHGYAALVFGAGNVLQKITLHGTDSRSSLALQVRRDKAGNGTVSLGALTSDGPGSLRRLDLAKANVVGAGINIDGTVADLRVGDVADNASLEFTGAAKDWMTITAGAIGNDVNLTFGGVLTTVRAKGWAGGTIDVANVGTIDIRGSDFGADLKIDPAKNPNGGFRSIRVTGGNFTGSIDVPGSGGTVWVYGGDVHAATVSVGSGGIAVYANQARLPNGTYQGGSVTVGTMKTAGRTSVRARGGSVEVSRLESNHDTWLYAMASRTQAGTGNVTVGLKLTGGRSHRISSVGGNVELTSLDVRSGGLTVYANATRVGHTYQGGGIEIGGTDPTIVGRTLLSARGGDLKVTGTLTVRGDAMFSAAMGAGGTGGNITGSYDIQAGSVRRMDARGGDIQVDTLTVAGSARLSATEMRNRTNGSYVGGSVTSTTSITVGGRLDIRASGGLIDVTATAGSTTRLWARASRIQPDTGDVRGSLCVTGGRSHRINATGGNVMLTSLDVQAGGLYVYANETRVGSTYQGGGIEIGGTDPTIVGRTSLSARGGDLKVADTLTVRGNAMFSSTLGARGTGGNITGSYDIQAGPAGSRLAGNVQRMDARGGSIEVDTLTVAGHARLSATEMRNRANGTYVGGSVRSTTSITVGGRLDINAYGGVIDVQATAGNNARLSARASRTQADTGDVKGSLTVTGGRSHSVTTYGGDVTLSDLQATWGNVNVRAMEMRGRGGSVTLGSGTTPINLQHGGLTVYSYGGNVSVTGTASGNTSLSARASRTQAGTGNVTAGLKLTGGRMHRINTMGGDICFSGDSSVRGALSLSAYGGDIQIDRLLKVLGDVTRLSATRGRNGTGGRLISAAAGTDLDISGTLRLLTAEQLAMDIQTDSLARVLLRKDHIRTTAGANDHGSIRVADKSGYVTGANGTIRVRGDADGKVHAYTA